jgi:8-oxo-dGTP pyrophosphatase MutT (NUDIX family)
MSFADHIRDCNSFNRAEVVPLVCGDRRIGWLRRDNAAALARFPQVFAAEPDRVRLVAEGDVDAVSAAVDRVVEALVTENRVPKWRNETFDVMARWGEPPIFRLDRGAVPFFGSRAYGVHLNGYVRNRGGLSMWIGRRAPDKRVSPDKLDNIVAGGIGNGHGILATLYKEAEEEAALPARLVDRAVPVGAVSYCMATQLGIRDDVLFVYDLELPADFVPHNRDGEIVEFELTPAEDVMHRVRYSKDFKFNVNLIILDFAIRHGLIGVDDPEYLDVASGLHRPLDQA